MEINVLKSVLVVTILAFGLYVYMYPPSKTKASTTQICADYSTISIAKLPISLLDEISSNYKLKQLRHINNNMSLPIPSDARAIKFDLETLKIFINKVESLALQNGLQNTESLGIRIYYASYPEGKAMKNNGSLTGLPTNYAGLHTLFAIPTIKQNGVDTDFDPTNSETYNNFFREMEPYAQNPTQLFPALLITDNSADDTSIGNTSAQNHGSLYPPLGNQGLAF